MINQLTLLVQFTTSVTKLETLSKASLMLSMNANFSLTESIFQLKIIGNKIALIPLMIVYSTASKAGYA